MLKHNIKRAAAKFFGFAAALFFTANLFSCKSADIPEAEPVDILKLIDSEATFFVYIPVKNNLEFVEYTLQKMADLSESDAKIIAERSNNIAISTSGGATYDIAVDGKFPAIGIRSAMSEKNGWISSSTDTTTLPLTYYSNDKRNMQVSSPVTSVLMASPDIIPMLGRYDNEAFKAFKETAETEVTASDSNNSGITGLNLEDYNLPGFENSSSSSNSTASKALSSDQIFEYLLDNKDTQIKFYSNKPGRVLKNFLGQAINLGLDSLSGTLTQSKADKTFALVLELNLSNPAISKAACKMLKVALFPIPAKIVQTGSAKITVSDISLTYNQLIKLITQ